MSPASLESSSELAWRLELATGIPAIDQHHQMLFTRLNALLGAASRREVSQIGDLFKFLHEHARDHFHDEEKLMQSIGYPGLARHRGQHLEFLESVAMLRQNFMALGDSAALRAQINQLLVDWLVKHIGVEDAGYVVHMKRARP